MNMGHYLHLSTFCSSYMLLLTCLLYCKILNVGLVLVLKCIYIVVLLFHFPLQHLVSCDKNSRASLCKIHADVDVTSFLLCYLSLKTQMKLNRMAQKTK